jgi:predicted metal-dependent hydrolase
VTPAIPESRRHSVRFGSRTIEFELAPADRRQLKIEVHPDRRVVVHAPQGKAPEAVAERVRKRAKWILKQLDYFEQFQPLPPPKQYVSGETHYYLGRQYRLKVEKDTRQAVKLVGRHLRVSVPDPGDTKKVAERMQLWYRQHARRLFAQRAEQCFAKLRSEGLPFPEVRLRQMPTRWGSYSRPGTILLNPELVKTPLYCIEYVIMHELCHLRHPDHGRDFHRLLTRCMPDWERRKGRLELAIL